MKKKVGDEIVEWLEGLEGALRKTMQITNDPKELIQMRARRGVYEGVAEDIKRKWPELF